MSRSPYTRPVLFVFFLLATYAATRDYAFGFLGTNDFIEYWTAFQLSLEGRNPYDTAAMLDLQRTLNPGADTPLMMWNPPWLLVLFAPVLSLSFEMAARMFAISEIIFWCASTLLILSTLESRIRPPMAAAGALIFFPAWTCIQLGQISLFLLFCASLALWAWRSERLILAGAALAVCSLKPHLVLLPAFAFVWWSIRGRRWNGVIAAALTIALLAVTSRLLLPSAFSGWLETILGHREITGVIHPKHWQVATLVGELRLLLVTEEGSTPLWPMVAVPGAALIITAFYLLHRRGSSAPHSALPFLLALSVFTSPYGWIFDHSLLLPLQLDIVVRSQTLASLPRAIVRSLLFGVSALLLVLQRFVIEYHHEYWWVPAALIAIWLGASLVSRKTAPAERY